MNEYENEGKQTKTKRKKHLSDSVESHHSSPFALRSHTLSSMLCSSRLRFRSSIVFRISRRLSIGSFLAVLGSAASMEFDRLVAAAAFCCRSRRKIEIFRSKASRGMSANRNNNNNKLLRKRDRNYEKSRCKLPDSTSRLFCKRSSVSSE